MGDDYECVKRVSPRRRKQEGQGKKDFIVLLHRDVSSGLRDDDDEIYNPNSFTQECEQRVIAAEEHALQLTSNLVRGQGRVEEARAHLEAAIAIDRASGQRHEEGIALMELGTLLSDEQRYKEAILQLQHAARLEPDLAQAHYRLAQAYQRTGQNALATKELEIFERLPKR